MSKSLNVPFTVAQRKVVADLLPHLAERLKLDEKNQRTITFTTQELESIRDKANVACRQRHETKLAAACRRYRHDGPGRF
jgi:hypothetical protein